MAYYIVQTRYGNETYDLREFIQKDSYTVVTLAKMMDASSKYNFIVACWNWVHKNIQYPVNNLFPEASDRHYCENYYINPTLLTNLKAFMRTGSINSPQPAKTYTSYDFWNFPAETLRDEMGDCEDTAILLCSLLRNRLSEDEVFVTVGLFDSFGHSWVTIYDENGRPIVLETTGSNVVMINESLTESPPYKPVFRFNDKNVIELYSSQESIEKNMQKDWKVAKIAEIQKYYGL